MALKALDVVSMRKKVNLVGYSSCYSWVFIHSNWINSDMYDSLCVCICETMSVSQSLDIATYWAVPLCHLKDINGEIFLYFSRYSCGRLLASGKGDTERNLGGLSLERNLTNDSRSFMGRTFFHICRTFPPFFTFVVDFSLPAIALRLVSTLCNFWFAWKPDFGQSF